MPPSEWVKLRPENFRMPSIRKLALAMTLPAYVLASTGAQAADSLQAFVKGTLHVSRYEPAKADLNGDGRPEVFIYVKDDDRCGSGGCSLYVLTHAQEQLSRSDECVCDSPADQGSAYHDERLARRGGVCCRWRDHSWLHGQAPVQRPSLSGEPDSAAGSAYDPSVRAGADCQIVDDASDRDRSGRARARRIR